ncbi:hypothetical protein [Flavobacterium aestuarii]|uniref:hypothetical protein n=1 Tax=Flavobacterium aestuarii TaxID=3149227 RepID=UPI0032B5CF17
MKFKLYLLSICLTYLTAFSQNNTPKQYTKKISEPYKSSKTSPGPYNLNVGSGFTFSKEKEILSCYIQNDRITIRKNDFDKLTLIKENIYEKYLPKNFFLVDCIELNGKYFVFYSSWDGDAKKEQVFSAEIDFAKCEFVGTPKVLFQIEGKVAGYNSGFIYFNLSESVDKKSIAINYAKDPENQILVRGIKQYFASVQEQLYLKKNVSGKYKKK